MAFCRLYSTAVWLFIESGDLLMSSLGKGPRIAMERAIG